jgi:hypothetical protein
VFFVTRGSRIVPKPRRALCGSAVVPEHSSESLAAFDRADSSRFDEGRVDEPVADPLMIPLAVVVLDVLTNRSPKGRFTERNDLS